ncbi:hypothetical protein E8E14_010986 [Neopestalotiopsis sp. 37M]|nr:hypothetical protein E8E14_010986 [Neopestalotiopsis sp. 37M]
MSENHDLHGQLNERLQSAIRRSAYESIKVLVLYWQDGHVGYREEGHAVLNMFKDNFGYPTEEFAIPKANGYAHLLSLITQSLITLGADAQEKNASSLLIIHYGGHGDADDDRHAGQERRSVWAAHADGEPTLKWARESINRRLEILAASAMSVKTPAPGTTSFTHILMREIMRKVENEESIEIAALHGHMCRREVSLWATPVYMNLKGDGRSIRLQPWSKSEISSSLRVQEKASTSRILHLLVKIEGELHSDMIDQVATWLGTDTPSIVSSLIFQTTSQIGDALKNMDQEDKAMFRGLDQPSREEIMHAWAKVVQLVDLFESSNRSQPRQIQTDKERAKQGYEFLRQLDDRNHNVLNIMERNILCSPAMQTAEVLQEAINDETVKNFGMADQLRLRRMIWQPDSSKTPDTKQPPSSDFLYSKNSFEEYKEYGPYVNPAELPELTNRVEILAQLLNASKSTDFRSLRCLSWDHDKLRYKYTLQLEIPPMYQSQQSQYKTLYSIIRKAKGPSRPTLNERLRIALLLAGAIQKWHSVGWVHQGISSHNIIFFDRDDKGDPDYRNPFLLGFELARPDSDPSIGRSVDDIAFNVYRHPKRQGTARRGHRKIHDLYSLGVVLLEIGLWQTAIDMLDRNTRSKMSAEDVQTTLQYASSDRLPHYFGSSYASAVSTCLGGSFQVSVDDEMGSHLARAFNEQVIEKIAEGIKVSQ